MGLEPVARAIADGGESLPELGRVQQAFGRHDVSSVRAHVGPAVEHAGAALGAEAFATGGHVGFTRPPTLHTIAHEAAHVVQQRGRPGAIQGLGAADDEHERHADEVADAVVDGGDAEGLLDLYGGSSGGDGGAAAVQLMRRGARGGGGGGGSGSSGRGAAATRGGRGGHRGAAAAAAASDDDSDNDDADDAADDAAPAAAADAGTNKLKRKSDAKAAVDESSAAGGDGAAAPAPRKRGRKNAKQSAAVLEPAASANANGVTLVGGAVMRNPGRGNTQIARRPSFVRVNSRGLPFVVPGAIMPEQRRRNVANLKALRAHKAIRSEDPNVINVAITISYFDANGLPQQKSEIAAGFWNSGQSQIGAPEPAGGGADHKSGGGGADHKSGGGGGGSSAGSAAAAAPAKPETAAAAATATAAPASGMADDDDATDDAADTDAMASAKSAAASDDDDAHAASEGDDNGVDTGDEDDAPAPAAAAAAATAAPTSSAGGAADDDDAPAPVATAAAAAAAPTSSADGAAAAAVGTAASPFKSDARVKAYLAKKKAAFQAAQFALLSAVPSADVLAQTSNFVGAYGHSEVNAAADPALIPRVSATAAAMLDAIVAAGCQKLAAVTTSIDSNPNSVCTNACRPSIVDIEERVRAEVRRLATERQLPISGAFGGGLRAASQQSFMKNLNPVLRDARTSAPQGLPLVLAGAPRLEMMPDQMSTAAPAGLPAYYTKWKQKHLIAADVLGADLPRFAAAVATWRATATAGPLVARLTGVDDHKAAADRIVALEAKDAATVAALVSSTDGARGKRIADSGVPAAILWILWMQLNGRCDDAGALIGAPPPPATAAAAAAAAPTAAAAAAAPTATAAAAAAAAATDADDTADTEELW